MKEDIDKEFTNSCLWCAICTILLFLLCGCSVITYDRVFPKLDWYWSKEARAQRADREQLRQLRQYQQTNSETATRQPPYPPGFSTNYSTLRPVSQANFTLPPPAITNIVELTFFCRPVNYLTNPAGGWMWNTNQHWAWMASTNGITWKTNIVVPVDGMVRYWRETNVNPETVYTLKIVP